jgi:LPXTG-motif cell wall-anchored protein
MEKKELPKTGGTGSASLLGLGVGALLVGGGLVVRGFIR